MKLKLILLIFLITQLCLLYGSVILIIGTRPEAIKLFPVYKSLKEQKINVLICSTGQHKELLSEVYEIFNIQPDFELNIMKPEQDLFYITNTVLTKIKDIFLQVKPSLVIVQGDTTSAMAAALAAFYLKIPVGHVEAGLRTGDIYAPFPEELNRKIISNIAIYHFAPTCHAKEALLKENINDENIVITGNTIVDTLFYILEKINKNEIALDKHLFQTINNAKINNKKILLLTVHRRESLDENIKNILEAIKEIALEYKDVLIIYPKHPNPVISKVINDIGLYQISNIHITEHLCYQDMVYLISSSDFVITDSGGIQEEAVSLGKQVLILRDKTERIEGILAGYAFLAGTCKLNVKNSIEKILLNVQKRSKLCYVYGDGNASKYIAKFILQKNS